MSSNFYQPNQIIVELKRVQKDQSIPIFSEMKLSDEFSGKVLSVKKSTKVYNRNVSAGTQYGAVTPLFWESHRNLNAPEIVLLNGRYYGTRIDEY